MKEIRNLGDVSSLEGRTVEGYADNITQMIPPVSLK